MTTTLSHTDATRLDGAQRLTFLPSLFSSDFMLSELSVYAYASRYIEGYNGGFWEYYSLPDGAGFMVPDRETVMFCNPDNWFEQEVSGEVAGIIVTAMVLNHRSFYHSHHDNDELCAHFCNRFSALMAFIETHPDAAVIQRALD